MSGLSIWFEEDVSNRLQALDQANDAALAVAEKYGMATEVARLCREVYAGALADVGAAFGLAPTMLIIPCRGEVTDGHSLPVALRQTL